MTQKRETYEWTNVLEIYCCISKVKPQEQITQSLLCISTTGSNDSEMSDTKLEAPSFPIEYKIFCSTFYAKPYINRFRND